MADWFIVLKLPGGRPVFFCQYGFGSEVHWFRGLRLAQKFETRKEAAETRKDACGTWPEPCVLSSSQVDKVRIEWLLVQSGRCAKKR